MKSHIDADGLDGIGICRPRKHSPKKNLLDTQDSNATFKIINPAKGNRNLISSESTTVGFENMKLGLDATEMETLQSPAESLLAENIYQKKIDIKTEDNVFSANQSLVVGSPSKRLFIIAIITLFGIGCCSVAIYFSLFSDKKAVSLVRSQTTSKISTQPKEVSDAILAKPDSLYLKENRSGRASKEVRFNKTKKIGGVTTVHASPTSNPNRSRPTVVNEVFPGSYHINQIHYSKLDIARWNEIIEKLKHCPGTIYIYGHSCPMGAAKYKQIVSEKRAECVAKLLTKKEEFANRKIISEGLSDTQAINDGGQEDTFAMSRRVTIKCL